MKSPKSKNEERKDNVLLWVASFLVNIFYNCSSLWHKTRLKEIIDTATTKRTELWKTMSSDFDLLWNFTILLPVISFYNGDYEFFCL